MNSPEVCSASVFYRPEMTIVVSWARRLDHLDDDDDVDHVDDDVDETDIHQDGDRNVDHGSVDDAENYLNDHFDDGLYLVVLHFDYCDIADSREQNF